MPESFVFHAPTRLVFGSGSAAQAGPEALSLGIKRLLIVTGRGPTKVSAGLTRLRASLDAAGIASELYAEVGHDPDAARVEDCGRALAAAACDGLLAYGGGSPMDCAKAASVWAANCLLPGSPLPGKAWLDFVYGRAQFARPGLPLIAVPTTAGSGSEMSSAAVTIDPAEACKLGLSSAYFFPRVALVDPEVQSTMPVHLKAATGMDALTHAVESYVSRRSTPFTRAIAGESARLILGSLARSCSDSPDPEAAADMALASSMVAVAFSQSGLGMVHGFAHPVGARGGVAHGVANAVILPHVAAACAETSPGPFAALAAACGLAEGGSGGRSAGSAGEGAGGSRNRAGEERAAEALVEAIKVLCARVGIPSNLHALGLGREHLPAILADAKGYRNRGASPRQFTDAELEDLLERMY